MLSLASSSVSNLASRDFGDDIVTSFINEGDFYLPIEKERRTVAGEVVAAFLSELYSALYGSDAGIATLANRMETMHIDAQRQMDIRFANLEAKLSSAYSPAAVPDEPTASGRLSDPAHRKLGVKGRLRSRAYR